MYQVYGRRVSTTGTLVGSEIDFINHDTSLAGQWYDEFQYENPQVVYAPWDGNWYLRAWFDDGTPLGSSRSEECRIDASVVHALADEIARAGTRFVSHIWRSAAAGNLGGWQIARCLVLLHVLTGSFGVPGGMTGGSE